MSKEQLIEIHLGLEIRFGNGNNIKNNCVKAKIKFKAIEYFNKIETENKNIINNFNNSTIGQFNQDSEFLESPINIKQM